LKKYSEEGFILLKLLSISGIFYSVNAIGSIILNIKHKIKLLILLDFINASTILSLSMFLLKMNLFGVVGVGVGWIVGQGIISIIYLLFIKKLLWFCISQLPAETRNI